MVSYQSGFADLIEKYVFYQESSGSWSEVRARNLRYFDRFCAERFPGRALCQEMVDAWCQKRDTETKSSCITPEFHMHSQEKNCKIFSMNATA